MLTDFLKLQGGGLKEVLKYACKHGVLDICKHGLPHAHHGWCAPPGWPLEGWTSLEAWRSTAGLFATILRISSDLKEDPQSSGRKEDWRIVFSTVQDDDARKHLEILNREFGLNMLQGIVNDYLRIGEVAPLIARTPSGWKLHVAGNSLYALFGSLAFQLALVLCGAGDLYVLRMRRSLS